MAGLGGFMKNEEILSWKLYVTNNDTEHISNLVVILALSRKFDEKYIALLYILGVI